MANFFRPVGPLSPRVYWVRRIVVLAIVVLVAALAIGLLGQVGKRVPSKEAAGTDKDAAAAKDKKEPGAQPAQCGKADIELKLSTDAQSYAAGKAPLFAVELRNAGEVPCLVDVNDTTRVLTIVSGKDKVWSSAHCVEAEPRLLLLKKDEVDSASIRWTRVRSDETCPKSPVLAKPGTYKAVVSLTGKKSKEVTFTLS